MDNQRKYERIDFHVKAEVFSLVDRTHSSAYISTLSCSGLGMHSQQFLEINTPIEMKIPVRGKDGVQQTETIQGKVVGVQIGEAGNSYGIQFNQTLSDHSQPNLFTYIERKTRKTS